MFDLTGRHALVTGAGSGIGRHAAVLLAKQGAVVTLSGRRQGPLAETAAMIAAAGGKARAVTMDLSDLASITAGVDAAAVHFGPADVLINNAGVAGQTSILEMTETEWDSILDTNLKGAWHCAREVAKRLIEANKPGVVVNVSSILGFIVQKGTGPYGASKAGLIHLTRAMAVEWARSKIRVNALAPGYIATDMTDAYMKTERAQKLLQAIPQRRGGTVEDMSGALLLLASEASAYMTGSVITVDGGLSLGAF